MKPISPGVWECYRTSGCIFQRRGRHEAKTLTLLPCLVLLLLLVFSGGSPNFTILLSSTKMISSLPSLSQRNRQNFLCEIWCFANTFKYLSLFPFLHVSPSQAATCRSTVNYCQCFCFKFSTRHMKSQWVEVTMVTTNELMKNLWVATLFIFIKCCNLNVQLECCKYTKNRSNMRKSWVKYMNPSAPNRDWEMNPVRIKINKENH